MTIKQLYVAIIIITIIYALILLFLNIYFAYSDVARIEHAVDNVTPKVSLLARIICDPIENPTLLVRTFAGPQVEEAKVFCDRVSRE